MSNIVLFPGQGSQKKGMGCGLMEEYKKLVREADAILGYSIAELCTTDRRNKLNQTDYTQPALYVVNALAYLKRQKDTTKSPDFLAGHSLGEYNALFAASVFDFETGLRLVQRRAQLMAAASNGSMAAVRGLNVAEIDRVLDILGITSVDITNINTSSQIVLSGPTTDLKFIEKLIRERGGFLSMINVSGPFHSRYMQPAQREFEDYIMNFEFKAPAIPVISNVTARPYGSGDVKRNLVEQLCQPVRWLDSIEFLLDQSQPTFEEVGPGRVLTKMVDEIKAGSSSGPARRRLPRDPKETLVDIAYHRAQAKSDNLAFRFLESGDVDGPKMSWTYAELDRRARLIAAHLQVDLPTGERVLLLYPPGLDFIAAFLGCLYGGYIAVPAFPPDPSRAAITLPRLHAIVRDAEPRRIMTTALIAQLIADGHVGEELASAQLFASDNITRPAQAAWQRPVITSNSLAFIQYTSGSTSKPKGVMVSHGNLLCNLAQIAESFGNVTAMTSWLPASHDMGLIGNLLYTIYVGGHTTLISPLHFLQRPMRWLETISHYRLEASGGPNFAYNLCVNKSTEAERAALDLSSWHCAINGSENVFASTLERFCAAFECAGFRRNSFSPVYGLAESTLLVSTVALKEEPVVLSVDGASLQRNIVAVANTPQQAYSIVSCGFLPEASDVVIVDPETRKRCGVRQVGEIWVSSDSVTQGYWRRDALTTETFAARLSSGEGPFLRTGDLGFVHAKKLFVTGRLKDLVIIRGRNVYPQDIETTVEQSVSTLRPGCSTAFSVNVGEEERMVIVAEARKEENLDVAACTRMIRNAVLTEHELAPHAVVIVRPRSIPKTTSGKLQRSACRDRYLNGELDAISGESSTAKDPNSEIPAVQDFSGVVLAPEVAVPPNAQSLVAWLVQHVAAALNLDPAEIDPETQFQHLGLESYDMVALSGELEMWIGRRLAPTLAYEYPCIQALANYLADESISAWHSTEVPPTFTEAIAIVGVGCRFPQAHGPDAFWKLLNNGVDAVREIPSDRWDVDAFYDADPHVPGRMYSRYGGFIDNVDKFDAGFFGISPREAEAMDPQQRLLLEVSWEALENAGIAPDGLSGSKTGVFIGMSSNDYALRHIFSRHLSTIDVYSGTGVAFSTAVGRIAYVLGLRGPSLAIDTACSSSLVAVHSAAQALRARECNLVLAGGVNLILSPEPSVYLCRIGALTQTGRCRTFDAAADGYVRGEGCGIIVMKRMSDAERDGDNILAVMLGSAVNQDGRSNGLTAPNGDSQRQLIAQALTNAKLTPADVSYVEAHGTGTPLGDPIEAYALDACFARDPNHKLLVGSVKTNIGHLEAAAGIAGLIKVVLSIREKAIPAHLHFNTPNPYIDWKRIGLAVTTTTMPWEGERRIAGVSAFGFGGTNAHVIIKAYQRSMSAAQPSIASQAYIITLSARTRPQLNEQVERLLAFVVREQSKGAEPGMLQALAYTLQCGRAALQQRIAIVATSIQMIVEKLEGILAGAEPTGTYFGSFQNESNTFALLRQEETATRAFTSELLDQGRIYRVAELWAGGASVDWPSLYKTQRPQALQAPTYPFARERHWLEAPSPIAQPIQEQVDFEALKSLPTPDLLLHLLHRLTKTAHEEISLDKTLAEVGVDSIIAMELLVHIERASGARVYFSDLSKKPNIATLSELVESRRKSSSHTRYPEFEVIQEGGTLLPVFWFHGGFGTIQPYIPLVRAIGGDLPFYAIQARGMRTDDEPIRDLIEMAKYYTKILLHQQTKGDFQLGGYSHGGRVAYEVARQLQLLGRHVKNIVLVDSAYPLEVKISERTRYIISLFNFLKTAGFAVGQREMEELLSAADLVSALAEYGVLKGLRYTKPELKSMLHRMATILGANLHACSTYKEQIEDLPDSKTPEAYYFERKNQEVSYGPFLGDIMPQEGEVGEALRNLNSTFNRDEVGLWRTKLPRLHVVKTPSEDHMTMFDDVATVRTIAAHCRKIYGVK